MSRLASSAEIFFIFFPEILAKGPPITLMRITFISTYKIKCGISEYTYNLSRALLGLGHEVTVLANIPSGSGQDVLQLASDPTGLRLIRCWGVSGWGAKGDPDEDIIRDEVKRADVVHWQFQNFLYDERLQTLFGAELAMTKAKRVVTLHDSGIGPAFRHDVVDKFLASRRGILDAAGVAGSVVPMGAVYRRPLVATFGLGRSNADLIAKSCERIGFDFKVFSWTDWVPSKDDFIDRLRTADALVLAFPDVGAEVVSSSVRDALATYRPVIVTSSSWFSDLMAKPGLVTFCQYDEVAIASALNSLLGGRAGWLKDNSWEAAARANLAAYDSVKR